MTVVLVTVHVIACLVLILVVLLQAGRGADMGAAFGGASTPMFGSGSASNPLARVTTWTAIAFMLSALLLAVSSARRASVFDSTPEPLAVTPRAESSASATPPAEAPPVGEAASPAASDTAAPAAPEAQPLTIPAVPAVPGADGGAGAPAAEGGNAAPADSAPAVAAPPAAPAGAPPTAAPAAPPAEGGTPPSNP